MIIPYLKQFKELSDLKVFASPWSPPAKFKTNGIRQYGGNLKKECYDNYADYLALYINKMNEAGINIDYMSLQNEPQAVQTWDSCIYSGEEEALLVEKLFKKITNFDTKLFIWDHNRDIIYNRVKDTINDQIKNMVYGIAYHWYDSGCSFELSKVKKEFGQYVMFFTEGCVELLNLDRDNPSSHIGNYENGLRYCRNYILDSENYSNAFIDWNMILDSKGGPNYVGNYCESPIMYNEDKDELIYNPSYYMISHLSKFIDKGDVRIDTKVDGNVIATSYLKQNGDVVSVLLNEGDSKTIAISIDNENYEVFMPSKSVITIVKTNNQ
jgi:glucosylceramidase